MFDQETVRQFLDYDHETGVFRWKNRTGAMARFNGRVAGTTNRFGYVLIGLNGVQKQAHRFAWLYVHGEWPTEEIDHIDRNPSNNAIANLRLASSSQQKMNRGVQSNNRAGLKGAFYHACHHGKKWRSQIKVGDRLIFLGYFHTPQDAHRAYVTAALRYYGEFAGGLSDAQS